MIIVDDKRPQEQGVTPNSAPSVTSADPWADWKPQWTGRSGPDVHSGAFAPGRSGPDVNSGAFAPGKKFTPHDMQEKHSPTEQVVVHVTAERQLHLSQRRITDARLWEAMTFIQQDAAIAIASAFEMMGRGMGYAVNNWQRIPGCRGPSNVADAHARLVNFYIEWAQKCVKRKIHHAMVVDILCFGFTCRMIDRDRRLKSGATRDNLMAGLSLYCQLRGWGN